MTGRAGLSKSSDKNAGIGPLPLFILAVEKHVGRYGGIGKRS